MCGIFGAIEGEAGKVKRLATLSLSRGSLVEDENRPRYQNIKWYLYAVGMDFDSTIERVNEFRCDNK